MTNLVMSVVLAVMFWWLAWTRVRVLFHDVDDAVRYVGKKLARPGATRVAIRVWESRPLSEHQIKELATLSGYRYLEESGDGSGNRSLSFERRRTDD